MTIHKKTWNYKASNGRRLKHRRPREDSFGRYITECGRHVAPEKTKRNWKQVTCIRCLKHEQIYL
jgi:hypothetical protein